jgi:hypothetical protein
MGCAISKNIVNLSDLEKLNEKELISRIENSYVIQYFINKWESDYSEIKTLKQNIKSIDIDSYENGLKNVLKFHLACSGQI